MRTHTAQLSIWHDARGFTLLEITTVVIVFIALSVIAIPKYFDLRERIKTHTCRGNQMAVESAIAVAYADSLQKQSGHFPDTLVPEMFHDGQVPRCPEDGAEYYYDRAMERAFCRTADLALRAKHNQRE